jgi:hypothetical protein
MVRSELKGLFRDTSRIKWYSRARVSADLEAFFESRLDFDESGALLFRGEFSWHSRGNCNE